ncbi:endocuticle structural glycoprotein SgAbd-5 isoform X1 [Plutella xylostella]|uniref:endocuticle structural glycoprotein SgAbd-5 isoform X1 n=1 Tax=Plutella xylostella TaxID=51655 RepID=UPI00203314BE|nr:endocuticle structural glycoprotein SgAbd-5 isoform X1 [Plutella xylostella]
MAKLTHLASFVLILSYWDTNVLGAEENKESSDAKAKTIEYENDNSGLGEYKFNFRTSNDIERSEEAKLQDDGTFVVEGFYSFTATDGKKYYVAYVADKTGYHPTVIDVPEVTRIEEEISPPVPDIVVISALPPNVVASLLGG